MLNAIQMLGNSNISFGRFHWKALKGVFEKKKGVKADIELNSISIATNSTFICCTIELYNIEVISSKFELVRKTFQFTTVQLKPCPFKDEWFILISLAKY